MIKLNKSQFKEIYDYAVKELPNEACGLLAGEKEGEDIIITKVYLLTNLDKSPEHFTMDPKEQFEVIKDIRKNNWQLIGNFHSHPSTPSRPSEEDKRLAFDPNASYFILSLAQEEPVLKSFKIIDNNVEEEKVEIVE